MTIKQHGGIFGRNPEFQSASIAGDATVGGNAVISGEIRSNGNKISANTITIADDAVGEITPPKTGGFLFITTGGLTGFPDDQGAAIIFYDVGSSLRAGLLDFTGTVSDKINVSVTDVTGTDGTDGKITVAMQSGVIKIENRAGGPRSFELAFV